MHNSKHLLVQQWIRRDENERRGEVPRPRYQIPVNLSHSRSPRVLGSTDEREWGATYHRFPSSGVHITEEVSALIVTEGMDLEASVEIAASPHIVLPPSPISEATTQPIDLPTLVRIHSLTRLHWRVQFTHPTSNDLNVIAEFGLSTLSTRHLNVCSHSFQTHLKISNSIL